jgi:hypothetical protein
MTRVLFVACRLESSDGPEWRTVGRLEHDEGVYRFRYTHGALRPGFKPFVPLSSLNEVYTSEQLFPIFAKRLLPKSRPEYESFLRWGGLNSTDSPDPISVLSVTEGIRQTDPVELFPCPVRTADGFYRSKFFLHGIRWMPDEAVHGISDLSSGTRLFLMFDVQNSRDLDAIAVRSDLHPRMIGYVPRYLASDVKELTSKCGPYSVKLVVDRVNLDAPLQNRLLCGLEACWPDDFDPCKGDDFKPIAEP